MSFSITNTEPSTNPKVTLMFSGLLVAQPATTDKVCEIGVHKFDKGHLFQVKLMIKKTNRPPVLVSLLSGPLLSGFELRLIRDPDLTSGPEPDPNFEAFAKGGFDRTPANSHPLDHQWAINLRSKHANARFNDGAKPVVTVRNGVLYTPSLTHPSLAPKLTRPGTADDLLLQIATRLAVSIEPPADTKVQFKGFDLGAEFNLLLPRNQDDDDPDVTYTLFFTNEPPTLLTEPHDEFALYYRIFEDATNPGNTIPPPQRFRLEFASGTSTDEIPCNPIYFNP